MNDKEVLDHFRGIVESSPDLSIALAAIHTIMNVLKQYDGTTLQELLKRLTSISDTLKTVDCSVASVSSGCELFRRFITLAKLEQAKDIQECKNIMLERGKLFLAKLSEAAPKITKLGAPFILDGMKVLTHSRSRIVLHTLIAASKANKRFHVYITQSSIDETGLTMERDLREAGIPCTLVLDSAVGYVMESVDLVMVGAEGVVESGGIINKIGTYTMALCAREMNKPFYVFAESFKFVRLYPLNQRDLPDHFKYGSDSTTKTALESTHPTVDYTPPNYITLLFTDLGILTPSAVSDELIKLYL